MITDLRLSKPVSGLQFTLYTTSPNIAVVSLGAHNVQFAPSGGGYYTVIAITFTELEISGLFARISNGNGSEYISGFAATDILGNRIYDVAMQIETSGIVLRQKVA